MKITSDIVILKIFRFVYTSEENGYNHWGELSFYPSGGYITDVPSNNSALALQSISNLKVNYIFHLY